MTNLLRKQKVEESNEKALFLQEQLAFLDKKKGLWREETVRKCVLLHAKSPAGCRLLREIGVLTLRSRCTLKRYIGACTGEVVSSLIKQRLHAEVKLHSKEARCGSLVMDEMSLKQSALYHKQSDALHGFVDLGGAEIDYGLEEQLATHLLCFVFVGLSTHYRLLWLENECLIYFDLWKERKFSSDDAESLLSTIRQLNGSNDQTDAYAALSSLQKILVTGCIHSSPSGNVGSVIGSIGEATKLAPQPAAAAPPDKDIKKLLLPYLTALERFPSPPTQSLRASTLALIAGFLVRAVQDNICCEGCLMKIQAPKSSSTTTSLIAGIDRGGLSYPSLPFVGFVSVLEGAASKAAAILVKGQKPLQKFSSIVLVLPSLLKNSLFACTMNDSVSHRAALLNLILRKFMRPFLANYANNLTEAHSKRKLLNRKPLLRKVLKV
ncbi:uncharacterized protein LOC142802647 [Rhipicephalus microplus]|uniref:uncharacterized protein LOC142802647 n=1 Tax=Rhipicephalus microplus TaxID=6941 RepID=UPI003F6ADCE4